MLIDKRPRLGDKPVVRHANGIWWADLPKWEGGLYYGSETCMSYSWRGAMLAVRDYWAGTLRRPTVRMYA